MRWEKVNTNINVAEDKVVNDVLLYNGYDKEILSKLNNKKIELNFSAEKLEKFIKFVEKFKVSKALVLVVSDYDGDGDTSGAIMYKFLKHEGLNVDILSLNREVGFGMFEITIDQIKEEYTGLKAIVTTDNGSKSSLVIDYARKVLGSDLEVIVTDHHDKDENIENVADIFFNPHYDQVITNERICGAMVVFVVVNQYFSIIERKDENILFLKEMLELAAVATYTDVMPVLEENRTALIFLTNRIRNNQVINLGLNTLIEVAGFDTKSFTAEDLGFKIGPVLNACGRLTSASVPTHLLISENKNEALQLAKECINTNNRRKAMTKELKSKIVIVDEYIHFMIYEKAHEGLIGIIAGNISQETAGPSFVFTKGENDNYKGSGRSPVNFDLISSITKIFKENPNLAVAYGGHPGAVGLTIKDKVSLDLFRTLINEDYKDGNHPEITKKYIDFPKGISVVDVNSSLERLEPYGEKLKRPVYRIEGNLNGAKIMAISHMSFYLNGEISIKMTWFNHVENIEEFIGNAEVYFTLSKNIFRGKTYYNGNVIDLKRL